MCMSIDWNTMWLTSSPGRQGFLCTYMEHLSFSHRNVSQCQQDSFQALIYLDCIDDEGSEDLSQ